MKKVEGDVAKDYQAIRKDSLDTVNRGQLVFADEESGRVAWIDRTGTAAEVTLGPGIITILPKHGYGR